MPRVSTEKRKKISEQIVHYLFSIAPSSKFTSEIAKEIARDEEFTKVLMLELEKNKIVILITKNQNGNVFIKRQRWRLSNEAYDIYKQRQVSQHISQAQIEEE